MSYGTTNVKSGLGNVVDGVMQLSPVLEIVAEEWQKTAQI